MDQRATTDDMKELLRHLDVIKKKLDTLLLMSIGIAVGILVLLVQTFTQ